MPCEYNERASFASFANWKYRRAVEREQEPTFVIEAGRCFLGILTAVITAFVGMAPGAAPPTRTHTKHDTALAVRVQVKVRKWHFELEHAFSGLRG